jgi:hypothetical protein
VGISSRIKKQGVQEVILDPLWNKDAELDE